MQRAPISGSMSLMDFPCSMDRRIARRACVVGSNSASFCIHEGKTLIGNNTPPRSHEADLNSQLIGSPFFTTIMKHAAMIPRLLADPIVKSKINSTEGRLLVLIPECIIKAPASNIITTLNVVMMNSQDDEPSTIVESPAGVDNIASSVPVFCASLSWAAYLENPTLK